MTDYTIAAQVKPPQVDPLGMVGNLQNVQAGTLRNKLLGQEIGGKIALGKAVTAATDPQTGKTDWDKAAANLAQDPQGSFQVPQFAADSLARHIQENNLTQSDLETSHKKLGQVGDLAYSLLGNADKLPLTADNITSAVKTNLFDTGVLTQKDLPMAASFLSRLTADPNQNAVVLKQLYAQFHPDSAGMEALRGHITQTDTGPATAITRTSPLPGEGTEGLGAIGKGLSPSEAQTPAYSYVDPTTGQNHIVTKAEAAGAAPGATPAGITSGMKVGTPELAGQGVKFEGDLTGAAHQWGDVHGTLSNFSSLIDQIASGPKAGAIKSLGQIAAQFGLAPPSVKNDTAAMEEAGKLAYQVAQRQFQQLGGTGTDSKLDSAMHTSPSEFLSQQGNKRIIPLLQGNNDALKAQAEAYQTWKQTHGPQDYSQFVTQWNQHYDPRVFQAAYMGPAEVAAMKKGMGATERANFDAFSAFAKKKGWLDGGQ